MAKKNVSPRQKMINMMYFVLLAMLAMNVTNEVLDSFESIRERLKASANLAEANNQGFVQILHDEIDRQIENEGKRRNEGLIDTLAQVQGRTQHILQTIATHIEEMEKLAQFDPEEGEFIRKDELDKNYVYWMGASEEANARRGEGHARDFRDELDAYATFLSDIHNTVIGVDSLKRSPVLRQDPIHSKKDPGKRWEQYTFEGPVVANLATLEALKVDVLQQEKELLETLNGRIQSKVIFVPDEVVAISAPASQIVPAGLPFETKLFVGMTSKQIKPKFASGSGYINVDESGNFANLKVMADARQIPNGQSEGTQSYTASIHVPLASGGYDTLQVRQSFTVRKPEVQVYSLAVQNLYRNCGNGLNIDVPALGVNYDPVVTATHARVKQSLGSKKKFMIIPTGRKSVVTVQSKTQGRTLKIDDLVYNVISPPKPEIDFRVNRRAYNGMAAVPRSSDFRVRLVPDAEFKRLLPKDSRYRITKLTIRLKNSLQAPQTLRTIDLSGKNAMELIKIPVPAAVRQARPGDKVYFVLEGIERINFAGRAEEVKLPELVKTLAVELR